MARHRVELPTTWTATQRDGLRYLLEQAQTVVEWDGDDAFTCDPTDTQPVEELIAYLEGKDGDHAESSSSLPIGDRRELVVAGRGLRFVGWLVDTLVVGLFGLALRLAGITGWPRFVAFEVLVLLDAIVLVAWLGGNLGNLVVGTQVVVAENARRTGAGRAAVRWSVIRVPMYLAALVGTVWLVAVWWIVVYGPILFTQLRQGLHDRAAGVVVITSRQLPEGWTFTIAVLGRMRR